jgi:hypothetical protein
VHLSGLASSQERRANNTAIRDILAIFSVEVQQEQLVDVEKRITGMLGKFNAVAAAATAFGAALAGNALVRFVSETVSAADDIGDMAARLGIATDEFQQLKAVAEDAGTSVGAIQAAFRNVANQVQGGAKDFAKLGISIRDAGGAQKSTADLFWEAGAAIGSIEDSNKRLAVAQDLFGRSALDLIPIFTAEKGSLDELKDAAVVYSAEFIQSADRVSKKQKIASLQWEKLKGLIVEQLLPAFTWMVEKVTKVVEAVVKWAKSGNATSTMIAALIIAVPLLVAALVPLAAEFLAMAAPVVGLLLALDDLVTFIRGGDSIIGRFLTTIFGEGASEKTSKFIKAIFEGIWELIKLLTGDTGWDQFIDQFMAATDVIEQVIDGLVAYFNRAVDEISLHAAEKLKGVFGEKLGSFLFGEDVKKTRENTSKVDTVLSGGHFGPKGFDPLNMPLTLPAIAPQPSLSAASGAGARAGGSFEDNRRQEVNVTVQGSATSETAREIGRAAKRAFDPAAQDFGAAAALVGLGR